MQKEDGEPFLSGAEITSALNQVGHDIRNANFLRGLSQEEFAIRAADIMSRINTIHPFREGNGRAQRTFMRELAKQAGHDLDFSVISAYRMILASVGSHEGDLSEMQRLFKDAVIPERRAALAQVIDNLEASGRSWDELYIAVAEPGYPVELKFIGISGAQFMGEDEGEGIIIGQSDDLPERPPSHGDKFILNPRGWSKPQAG
jgi:cell filamentation protein